MVTTPLTGNALRLSADKKYSLSRLLKSKSPQGNKHCWETEISDECELSIGKKEFDFLVPPEVLGIRRCDGKRTKNNAGRIIRIIKLDLMSIKLCV